MSETVLFPCVRPAARRGFTLIEMSIVLVIIGLITGGVMAGQSLIRAAEIRSVATQFNTYVTAVNSFSDKYNALPGDIANATQLWGAQAGGTANGVDSTCAALTTGATSTPTCNGNGNGLIGLYSAPTHEAFRAWQHLVNGGFLEGKFSGISGPGNAQYVIAPTNAPASRINQGSWCFYGLGSYAGDTGWFAGHYGNLLMFGIATSSSYINNQPILKAEEAWNLDTKIDDGKPHTGNMLTYKTAIYPNCVVGTNDAYNTSTSSIACNVLFITGF